MKKITLTLLFPAIISTSCMYTGKHVKGNEHVITDTRQASGFKGVHLSSSYDVYLTEGSDFSVKIEGEENILPYIKTYVQNDVLQIENENNVWISSHKDVKIYITAPRYEKIYLSGSGDIVSQGKLTNESAVDIDVTGAGEVKLDVDAPEVKARITGSGDVTLSGETKKFIAESMGSGDLSAFELKAEETSMQITGSGDADVFASMKLNAAITGSGDIRYKGDPEISKSVTGSGSVSKVN